MIRYRIRRFDSLDRSMLLNLQGLTNSGDRGDVKDDGRGAGSVFRRYLDERLCGQSNLPHDCWAVLAYDWLDLCAWSMLTRRDRDPEGRAFSTPPGVVGFYVRPTHRRRGLGLGLIQRTSDHARKNGMQRLLANPWNRSSLSFFLSAGFTVMEEYVPGVCHGVAYKDL